jgi:hypothetical protein
LNDAAHVKARQIQKTQKLTSSGSISNALAQEKIAMCKEEKKRQRIADFILLRGEGFFDFPAFEMADGFWFKAEPALIVSIDCRKVSCGFQSISSSGTSSFYQVNVFFLGVDLTNRAIFLLKGNRKEFSFRGGD